MGLRLQDGDRVCIVGGGPAGSYAALQLLGDAARHGLRLEVMVFEPHSYAGPGPKSCKGCAGILSDGGVRNLAGLGLKVPPAVVQAELNTYVVHVSGQVTSIAQPDPRRHILSVYRGAGPRLSRGPAPESFDAWLLSQALTRGACRVSARVRRVEWAEGPVVYTDDGSFPAQLLVLATGVNSRPPLSPAFGYVAPGTAPMIQDEIVRPAHWRPDTVAGFFDQPPGLVFGALVPKGPYLNVSLMWRGDPTGALPEFYASQREALRRLDADVPESLCGCHPRILKTPAKVFYGDRWVAVGDAAITKLYKDGIHSAFNTAGRAMRVALEHGIDAASFREAYEPSCRGIAQDNRYGALLYTILSHTLQNPVLAHASVGRVRDEAHLGLEQRVHSRLMWGMLTGDEHYRDLFRLFLKPRGLLGFGLALVRSAGRQAALP